MNDVSDQPDPVRSEARRDFLAGSAQGRRDMLWYETYSDGIASQVRQIIRRAVESARKSTDGRVAIRVLPSDDDDPANDRARAAVAAGWQGRFFEMHRRLTGSAAPPRRVYALWPYLALGVLLWAAIFAGGLHATLAGVLTALAIPSRRPASVHGVAAQTTAIMRKEAEEAENAETFTEQTVERLGERSWAVCASPDSTFITRWRIGRTS